MISVIAMLPVRCAKRQTDIHAKPREKKCIRKEINMQEHRVEIENDKPIDLQAHNIHTKPEPCSIFVDFRISNRESPELITKPSS